MPGQILLAAFAKLRLYQFSHTDWHFAEWLTFAESTGAKGWLRRQTRTDRRVGLLPSRVVVEGVIELKLYGLPLAVARFPEFLRIFEHQDAMGWADRNFGGTGSRGPRTTG